MISEKEIGLNVFFVNANTVIDILLEIVFVLYFIFSLIIIRQISLMTDTVITESKFPLKFIGYIHAVISLIVALSYIGVIKLI